LTTANSRLIVDADGSGVMRCLRRISSAWSTVSRGFASRAACTACRHASETFASRGNRVSISASNPCSR
jgi:hypothetical protein